MYGNAKYQTHHMLSKTRQVVEHLRTSRVENEKRGIHLRRISLKRLSIQWRPPDLQNHKGKK